MPEQKPELLPCPLCGNKANIVPQFPQYVRCKRGACPLAFKVWISIEDWNSRLVSELERLAREVATNYTLMDGTSELDPAHDVADDAMWTALDALAAFLAEPSQKGKHGNE